MFWSALAAVWVVLFVLGFLEHSIWVLAVAVFAIHCIIDGIAMKRERRRLGFWT